MASQLDPGRQGVFLTEGDPLLFGTFAHVAGAMRRLRPDVCVQTVPGVSSVTAAAAAAGVALVDGDERLAVVPATSDLAIIEQTLLAFDCTVLLEGGPGCSARSSPFWSGSTCSGTLSTSDAAASPSSRS